LGQKIHTQLSWYVNVDFNLRQCIFTHALQQGELAHRLVKQLYSLTNKKNAIQQIGKKYTRQQAFRSAEQQEEKEADKTVHLSDHHIISRTKNALLNLLSFAQTKGDPAKKVWQ
jgi:hypothetical protein